MNNGTTKGVSRAVGNIALPSKPALGTGYPSANSVHGAYSYVVTNLPQRLQ